MEVLDAGGDGGGLMLSETTRTNKNRIDVKSIAITALFTALVLVFTVFVNVQLPFGGKGGLIHLGNIPLFVAAILFGKKVGAIAGGVGMALFDLLSGWTVWAPFTLVIVGLMGFAVGGIAHHKKKYIELWSALAVVVACAIKVVGYYFAEVILYSNYIVPFASIPGNVIQVSVAGIVTLPLIRPLRRVAAKMDLVHG